MSMISDRIRRLPLHEKHVGKGAKWGAFGEWEVPLYYTSILEEHEAVRKRAGLFDISHMGTFWIEGKGAESYLEELLPRPVHKVSSGQALYSPLLNEHGGFVDDIILYRFSRDRFFVIVNASNVEKDFRWMTSKAQGGAEVSNVSERMGILSLQGPASSSILSRVCGDPFAALKYYHFRGWQGGMIARTGYTGEDGFEIAVDRKLLSKLWEDFFKIGSPEGLVPAGFGARDTLRFEAAMLLYGNDMDERTTPLEAGIEWAVDLEKGPFIGREALRKQKREGVRRRLAGFEMVDRGIPRHGCEINKEGSPVGHVTSGTFSPTFRKNLGLGYVTSAEAAAGNEIEIIIRGNAARAKIVPVPFYRRKR